MKPVIPRAQADADIDEALAYTLDHAPAAVEGLLDAFERAFRHIGARPATGSPRYAHALDLPGLRSWVVTRHPYLVFYMEHETHIDVLRVLHQSRDIPAEFRD